LAISKQLVTLMNGQVGVNSELGRGSEFWFSMPFKRSKQTHNEAIIYKPLENIYALLVDDHDINRPIFEKILLAKNIKLDLAVDADSVLNKLEQAVAQGDMYDILIVNLSITSKNNLNLIDMLRADQRFKALPIVLLSAEIQSINRKEAVKHGVDIFLTKPVRINLIYSSLLNVVGYRSLPEQHKDIDKMIPRLEKILIAEDNIVNQKVISRMLLKLGFNGHVVDNGREAVQAVKKQTYDLIFMDMQMPELDGIAATREIRNLKNHNAQKVPIIALTANVMESDKQACFVAGMSEFVMKPLKVVTLREIIDRFLPDC